jgi:hypothetical protein
MIDRGYILCNSSIEMKQGKKAQLVRLAPTSAHTPQRMHTKRAVPAPQSTLNLDKNLERRARAE